MDIIDITPLSRTQTGNQEQFHTGFPGDYFLPYGRTVRTWGAGTGYEYCPTGGYIKECEVDLSTGALRWYENIDLPVFIWGIINLNENELLIAGEGGKYFIGTRLLLIADGHWVELDTEFYSRYPLNPAKFTGIEGINALIFEEMDMSDDRETQKGENLTWYDLETNEWEKIAYIPKELFEQEFCAVVSEDTGVICWPLEFEGTGTEWRFYDVGRKKNAGTLIIDGRIGVACLILQENSPFPDEGEVIVSNE